MADLTQAFAGARRTAGDPWTWRTALVEAVDPDASRLEVTIDGATSTTDVIRVDGTYVTGDRVAILRNPDGTMLAIGTIAAPRTAAADAPAGGGAAPAGLELARYGARVDASWSTVASATQYRYRTTLNGGTTWASAVTLAGTSVTLGIGQGKTLGVQVAALVSGSWTAWSATVSVTYPVPPGSYVTATATIAPIDSGTYRAGSGWDRWNVGRWGGARDVYQGNAYGSGDLTGWLGYGSKILDLGADSIDSIVLKVRRNGWIGYGSATLTVQGTASGTQPGGAPSGTGATATTGPAYVDGWAQVALPSTVREAMRTGSIRGLVTAGTDDGGWGGASPSGVLVVTYRKRA